MVSDHRIVFIFWLLAIMISLACGVKIRFFRNYDYTGLIHESSSTDKCNNFPGNEEVHSFTTDACLILYRHSNCQSTSSYKIMPSNYSAIVGRYYPFASFHVCNEEEGGSQLNVDITEYYENDKPADVPAVLERYRQVCTCVNIPDYVQKMDKWSINNHHNDFLAFYEPDCLENNITSTLFNAGQNDEVRNIYEWTHSGRVIKSQYHILSIGPDKNSTYFRSSCIVNETQTPDQTQMVDPLQTSENSNQTVDELAKIHIRDFQIIQNISRILEKDYLSIRANVSALENQNQGLFSKVEELEKKVIFLESELASMKENELKADMKVNASAKYIRDLQSAREDLSKNIDTLNIKADNVEKALEEKFEKSMEDRFKQLKDELEVFLSKQNTW